MEFERQAELAQVGVNQTGNSAVSFKKARSSPGRVPEIRELP